MMKLFDHLNTITTAFPIQKNKIEDLYTSYMLDKVSKSFFKRNLTKLLIEETYNMSSTLVEASEVKEGENTYFAYYDCVCYLTTVEDAADHWNVNEELLRLMLSYSPAPDENAPGKRREISAPSEVKKLREPSGE